MEINQLTFFLTPSIGEPCGKSHSNARKSKRTLRPQTRRQSPLKFPHVKNDTTSYKTHELVKTKGTTEVITLTKLVLK